MRLNIRLLSSAVQKRPFYVTTPIFYVNAAPHLGHLYSAVVADAIQRFEKLTNPDCNIIFSTGTDEHGTKIQQAAAKAKLPLPEYCSKTSDEYRTLFKEFNVDFTDYVRTTEKRHKVAVKHFWNKLMKKDYIYKAKYSGWYSVNDESFVPEAHTREDIVNGEKVKVSVESGHRVEWTEETNYMFRLSAFKTHLKEWLSTDGVITPNKFQKQLQELLENEVYFPDISVSRPSSRVHWAIRVPNDEEQSIYVWLDALINYLTAIGYPDEDAMIRRGRPWPADVHVVGKDILKFHGIYWPAFLMATSWPPPRRLVCHSHWTVDGSKMSKSLGNVVDPRRTPVNPSALRYLLLREATMASDANGSKMSKSLGNVVDPRRTPVNPSALRYLLLREATMSGDANYSETKLINVANSELADTLGNLASRCCGTSLNPRQEFPPLHVHELATCRQVDVTANLLDRVERLPAFEVTKTQTHGNLASRCCGASLNPRQEFPPLHVHELATCRQVDVTANLLDRVERLPEICHEHYSNYQFYKAVDAVIHTLHLANLFFETHKPWELRKQVENQKHLDVILHITMETLRICGIILQPIIPDMSQKLLDKLQIPKDSRNWQHCERPSWSIEDAIYETKYIQNGKFVLFQRVYVDKNNVQKKKAKA